jgi:hypothetical protein
MKRLVFTRRRLLLTPFFFLAAFAAYLTLLSFPGAFFAYTLRRGRLIVRSDRPIPVGAAAVLDVAENRLTGSPLNRPSEPRWIYVCNSGWRFLLFANFRHHVGGLTYPPLTNNVFLRGSRFDVNRLIGPSGTEVPGERTLSYFIAHELAHTLIADHLGAIGYWKLPDWKNEGYSDYVAKGSDFDYQNALRQLRQGDPQMDPVRSGLYLRYHVLVAYLLLERGISVRELFDHDFDATTLERELGAARAAPR